jgi:hypothetical protein
MRSYQAYCWGMVDGKSGALGSHTKRWNKGGNKGGTKAGQTGRLLACYDCYFKDNVPSVPPIHDLSVHRLPRVPKGSGQALKARRHGYQRILHPLSTRFQNRTTVGVVTTRQRRLYHDCPVWPCTHALYPCIRRPPPRKHQRLPA